MVILGISWSIGSSAAIMVNGRVVAAAMEERYNRKKNYEGYPASAIDYCLKQAGVSASEIDQVVFASIQCLHPDYALVQRYSSFSVGDMIREQEEYWYPRLYEGKATDFKNIFKDHIRFEGIEADLMRKMAELTTYEARYEAMFKMREQLIERHLGIAPGKISNVNHHSCHAAYAANAFPHDGRKRLIFTVDGAGDDGENASVHVWRGGKMEKIFHTAKFGVGRLYRHATLLLGMKMAEHEFKVMGLAPYAKPYHSDRPYKVYKDAFPFVGTEIHLKETPQDSYFYFKEKLKACRFDGIAGGVQRFTEDALCGWISGWMEKTGIRDIAYSGGVAMNIKANLCIQERCNPSSFLVPGSGSDESTAIGACYFVAEKFNEPIEPMANMYLGDEVSQIDSDAAIARLDRFKYEIREGVGAQDMARELADGKILGRCRGRMEFGARALGNRSLLADPRQPDVIRTINDKIKSRDFWMPFAPSLLDKSAPEYLDIYPGVNYSAMSVGAASTSKGAATIRAALHPADMSGRPHVVSRELNPDYYELIDEFQRITGVGCVLNTSLNLHGLPIVRTPADAIHVLENSHIDGIQIANTLVLKKKTT